MASRRPMPGPGCHQWNTVAWFGGQVGCTAWMLVGAAMLAREAREVAVVWAACFCAANAAGSRLWSRRRRLRPFPAIQIGFLVCGVSGVLALVTLHVRRPGLRVTQPAGVQLSEEPWLIPAFLVLVLLLMAQSSFLEWGARKERARSKSRA
jgi:hypothetical protein